MSPCLIQLTAEELQTQIIERGGRPFHAKIIREQVFGNGVIDYAAMTSLPKGLRERLGKELPLFSGREENRTQTRDGTIKLLLRFPSGASVETVYIPSRRAGRGATLCVSTQAGCPVGCPFCASGKEGLERNLEAHEILEQYVRGRALGPLSRSVVMGIGEPFLNLPNLEQALEVVRKEIGIGARKLTVSTVGFPERLAQAARNKPGYQLAISLHSPFDRERSELVPAMAGVAVEDVLAAGDDWFTQTGREVTYEIVLLGGLNDSNHHAAKLADRLRNRRATVNLIPYNPIPKERYRRPSAEAVQNFQQRLQEAGIVATVRWSRGLEEDAACGQLRRRNADTQTPA